MNMLKQETVLIKLALVMLTLAVTSCANVVSNEAICDGTAIDRTEHARALAHDGGDQSVITGAKLIKKIDVACGDV